jgi:hypothetical protein
LYICLIRTANTANTYSNTVANTANTYSNTVANTANTYSNTADTADTYSATNY